MANPTNAEFKNILEQCVDDTQTGTSEFTDTEVATLFSKIVGEFNNISPSRKVKQRHIVENTDITFE